MLKTNFHKWRRMEIIGILSILIMGCNLLKENNGQEPESTAIVPLDTESYTFVSAIIYSTFSELVNQSDVILIGQAVSKTGIVNTTRDPDNHAIPDPEVYSVGQIYQIEIESYIKGEGPSSMYIIQNEGFFPLESSSPSEEEIERAKEQADQIPLIIGRRYIMFLVYRDPDSSYDEFPIDDFLFARGHPWRFEITDTNCVQPEDGLQWVYSYFPPMPLNEFLQYLDSPTTFTETPYPGPINPERCPGVVVESTPYP